MTCMNKQQTMTEHFASYTDAVVWIQSLVSFGIRPGLDRVLVLLDELENPHRHLAFIHVGGTNGKGSTCAFLTSILLECGYKVGTFTSPYITSFTNRIQYNGKDIKEETVLQLANLLYPLVVATAQTDYGSPTMFEVCTVMAILYYAHVVKPDIVVWEVGLGGRLDATNVVTPIFSIITNIGMDHTDVLGDDIRMICMEKSGIIKKGVPVISCVDQRELIDSISDVAMQKNAPFYLLHRQFTYKQVDVLETSQTFRFESPFRSLQATIHMQGEHQCANAAAALMGVELLRQYRAFHLPDEEVLKGLKHTFWHGRLEQVCDHPRIILDGAHNPEGAAALAKSISQNYSYEKLHFMIGMLSNKHHSDYFMHILPLMDTLILTEPNFRGKMDAYELKHKVDQLGLNVAKLSLEIIVRPSWMEALHVLKSKTQCGDIGMVTGTLYLVGDVRAVFFNQTRSEKGW